MSNAVQDIFFLGDEQVPTSFMQGRVEILLVASCYRNRDKLQHDRLLGSNADFSNFVRVGMLHSPICSSSSWLLSSLSTSVLSLMSCHTVWSSSNWSSVSEMPSPTAPSTEQWSSMLVATIVPSLAAGLEQLQQKYRLLSLSWIKISAVIGDPNLKETLARKWYLIQQQPLLNRIFKEPP